MSDKEFDLDCYDFDVGVRFYSCDDESVVFQADIFHHELEPEAFVFLGKDSVIAMAKHFKLTEGDLK